MTEEEEFIEVFRPHTGRYVERHPGTGYKLRRKELTTEIIAAHMRGERVISFFTRVIQNIIGMDVDDHEGGGWVGEEPTAILVGKYRELIWLMGQKPSGVFKSDHGVHVYWVLATSVPDRILIEGLKDKLGELLTNDEMRIAEVLPTNRAALKIPRPDRYLDDKLMPATFSGYRAMTVYTVGEVFGEALTPDSLRYHRARQVNAARSANTTRYMKDAKPTGLNRGDELTTGNVADEEVKAEATGEGVASALPRLTFLDVEKVEYECGPFKNGQGNQQYLNLIKVYRRAGVSQGDAVERIRKILARSPGYIGDIRTGVEARVAASYRRLKGPAEGIGLESAALRRDRHAMAFITLVIDDLGVTNAQQRQGYERFLLKLWAWKKYLDDKMANPAEVWAWDYRNPRFRKMMMEGYYPLPSKLLRGWRHDYNEITCALKKLGVIVESPYHYSADLGYCKHYMLNLNKMQRAGGELELSGMLTIAKVE